MKYLIEYDDKINLKKELTRLDITLRELSKITGIHFATLCSIKNGSRCSEKVAKHIKNCLVLPKQSYKKKN